VSCKRDEKQGFFNKVSKNLVNLREGKGEKGGMGEENV